MSESFAEAAQKITGNSWLDDVQRASLSAASAKFDGEAPSPAHGPLAPVYSWLVDVLGFPLDMCTAEKPAWLDVTALSQAWAAKDARDHDGRTETVEDWAALIYAEAGWAEEEEGARAASTAPSNAADSLQVAADPRPACDDPCACTCHAIELRRSDVARLLRIAMAPLEDVSLEDHHFVIAMQDRLEGASS